jgi:hypothetical protein
MEHIEPYDDPDLDNPYAPPKAAPAPVQATAGFSELPFTASDIFGWSWAIYKDNLGMVIGLVIGAGVLTFGINMGMGVVLGVLGTAVQSPEVVTAMNFVFQIAATILQYWLTIGMTLGLLKVARRQPVAFDVVFSGGRYLLRVILAGILVGLIFAAVFLPLVLMVGIGFWAQGTDSPAGWIVLGCAVLIGLPLTLYLSARLLQFFYFIIDRDAGVTESINLSWQATRNRSGTIILLYFIAFGVNLAGVLACFVGLIFAVPLSSLIAVVTYLALTGKVAKPAAARLTSWEEEL